jgi:hypothetical protein
MSHGTMKRFLHLRLETEMFMKEKSEVVALNLAMRSGFGIGHGSCCRIDRLFVGPAAYKKINGFKIINFMYWLQYFRAAWLRTAHHMCSVCFIF